MLQWWGFKPATFRLQACFSYYSLTIILSAKTNKYEQPRPDHRLFLIIMWRNYKYKWLELHYVKHQSTCSVFMCYFIIILLVLHRGYAQACALWFTDKICFKSGALWHSDAFLSSLPKAAAQHRQITNESQETNGTPARWSLWKSAGVELPPPSNYSWWRLIPAFDQEINKYIFKKSSFSASITI